MPVRTLLQELASANVAAAPAHWDPCTIKVGCGGAGSAGGAGGAGGSGEEAHADGPSMVVWAALVAWARDHPAEESVGDRKSAGGDYAQVRERLMARHAGAEGTPRRKRHHEESSLHVQKRRRREQPTAPKPASAPESSVSELSAAQPTGRLADTATCSSSARTSTAPVAQHAASAGCKFLVSACGFPFARDARADAADAGVVTVFSPHGGGGGGGSVGCGSAEGPSQPPDRVVLMRCKSLSEAVQAAPPCSLLLLGRGDHQLTSAVIIDKALSISAARGAKLIRRGAGSAVVVDIPDRRRAEDAPGCGVWMHGGTAEADVVMSGLAIYQRAAVEAADGSALDANIKDATEGGDLVASRTPEARTDGESAGYALVVRSGHAVLLQCAIESEVAGCCFATAACSLELRSCQLRRSSAHGLLASGKSRVRLSHCHVQSTQAAGVEARGRAVVRLHGCRIHRCQRSGVFASAFSEVHAEFCNVFDNAFAAVESAAEAEASMDRCWMHHGKRGGALALGRSWLRLNGCEIYSNAMAGVDVRGSARASVTASRVAEGRASGVHVSEGGTVEMTDNDVTANQLCGVELEGRAATLVARRNRLTGNGGGALSLPDPQLSGQVPPPLLDDNVLDEERAVHGVATTSR